MALDDEWQYATKKPVTIEYRGPYHDPAVIETIEGDFEVDEEYIEEHRGYVIIKGVNDEVYPCGVDIFEQTYTRGPLAADIDPNYYCPGCETDFDTQRAQPDDGTAEPDSVDYCPYCGGDNVVRLR